MRAIGVAVGEGGVGWDRVVKRGRCGVVARRVEGGKRVVGVRGW